MRSASLLAAVCALAITTLGVVAVDEAQQSTVHLRIHTESDADAIATDVSAALEETSQQHAHHAKTYYDGSVRACRAVVKEWFAGQIKNACVKRAGGHFNFYYQLNSGQVMRNCLCSEYNPGVQGVSLGTTLARDLSTQCYTKEGKSAKEVIAIFNNKGIMCGPFEFE